MRMNCPYQYLVVTCFSIYIASAKKCKWVMVPRTFMNSSVDHLSMGLFDKNKIQEKTACDSIYDCKVVIKTKDQKIFTLQLRTFLNNLRGSRNRSKSLWIKVCGDDYIHRKLYLATRRVRRTETSKAMTLAASITVMPQRRRYYPTSISKRLKPFKWERRGISPTKEKIQEATAHILHGYKILSKVIPIPHENLMEGDLKSWCTYSACTISPRTYFQIITPERVLIGFTNSNGQGTILVVNELHEVLQVIYPKLDGKRGKVAGLYGFHNGKIAVALYVHDTERVNRRMHLQLYRNDSSMEWSSDLHSDLGVPDRNVGDFRLSYGNGYFAVYFSIFGISKFAEVTNGEQLTFVSEQGTVMSNSFRIPGQEFVKKGFRWGCSHSLGGLIEFHPLDDQFFRVCSSDLYPKGISTGDLNEGTLLFRTKAGGYGYTSAQIGQIAPSNECCTGKGIGMISIYNERDDITGEQSFDEVVWLTDTKGVHEKDAVIARYYPEGTDQSSRERFLVGWHNKQHRKYYLATINTFGSIIEGPFAIASNLSSKCPGGCVKWGNRDDSFQSHPDGSVGWLSTDPNSRTIMLHRGECAGQMCPYLVLSRDTVHESQWSLWSGWAMCSRSCGGGTSSRLRKCLHNEGIRKPECNGENIEVKNCNLKKCEVPITCTFEELEPNMHLIGNLIINQEVQFGYSNVEATEKCIELRYICWGFALEYNNGSPFYVLKTSQATATDKLAREEDQKETQHWLMECKETPGWSKWSTWYACSVTCGNGMHHRNRFCDGDKKGSEVCRGDDEERKSCYSGPCPTWGDWTTWSRCSATCNNGKRVRERTCIGDTPEACADLTGPSMEAKPCSEGTCPFWGLWTTWEQCDKTCGHGTRVRIRKCEGDFDCSAEEDGKGTKHCNLGECHFLYEWGQWSQCSVSCGKGGSRTRSRKCGGDFPNLCDSATLAEVTECSVETECPRWYLWTTWSSCSTTCGPGVRRRFQTCTAVLLKTCDRVSDAKKDSDRNISVSFDFEKKQFIKEDAEICTLGLCSYWESWSVWGLCSASCNAGYQTRTRSCFGDFPKDCDVTGVSEESKECVVGTCGVWSNWSAWGKCSKACGKGTWSRSRTCKGDILETCEGSKYQENACDIGDCVPQCENRPCNNGGRCRENAHLTGMYHCECQNGWIGRHCDYPGPDVNCGKERIDVRFDGRALSDEMLVPDKKYVALSGFTDVAECSSQTYAVQPSNNVTMFALSIPEPLDVSCGSDMEITGDEIQITNRVEWLAEDQHIQARVIVLEFTCVYETESMEIAMNEATGSPLKVSSFKKSVGIKFGSKDFRANINLFRDSTFSKPILRKFGNLLQIAEGQIVYVSVKLVDAEMGVEAGARLVMNTCFVTASDGKINGKQHKPILYLLKNRCPTSPFVKVISNGESESGRLSLRVFGWTGRSKATDNLYLHCTVEICQGGANNCKPTCTERSSSRGRRAVSSDDVEQNPDSQSFDSQRTMFGDFMPYPSSKIVVNDTLPAISVISMENIYAKHMVSLGPITVELFQSQQKP